MREYDRDLCFLSEMQSPPGGRNSTIEVLQNNEHFLNHQGSRVLVCEYELWRNMRREHYAVVPGRVVSIDGKKLQVEPITDSRERRELTDLIRTRGIEGPVRFWK